MGKTIIDELVVTLGLDPKQFAGKISEATAAQDKFSKGVKALGLKEKELTAEQQQKLTKLREAAAQEDKFNKQRSAAAKTQRDNEKASNKALRDAEVQATRTRKELSAAAKEGDEFWGVLKRGALAFGAALGVEGIREMALQSIGSNASTLRTAATLGLQGGQLDTWVKAIRELSGGSGEGAVGTLSGVNAISQGATLGDVGALGALQRLQFFLGLRTGIQTPVMGRNNRPLGATQILENAIPAIQKLGVEGALTAFQQAGVPMDLDTLTALAQGRDKFEGGLSKAGQKTLTPQGFADAEEAAKKLNELSDAIGHLKDALTLLGAPRLIRDITQFTARIALFQDKITQAQYDKIYQDAEDTYQGPEGVATRKTQEAYDKLNAISEQQDLSKPKSLRRTGPGGPIAYTWTQPQRMARLRQLINAGRTPEQAAIRVGIEESTGGAPGARPGAIGISYRGPADVEKLLDYIHKKEGNGISSAGAKGPYGFMDATWASYGEGGNVWNEKDARNGARRLLLDLFNQYKGSPSKALAAYNSNPAHVNQAIAGLGDDWIAGMFPETQRYVEGMPGGFSGGGGDTTIHQNGDVTINVANGDPHSIARGWHKAVTDQCKGTGAC